MRIKQRIVELIRFRDMRNMKIIFSIYLGFILFSNNGLLAQMDSLYLLQDTIATKTKEKRAVIPKKSLKLSLIFPGTGQIYNGRWWKAPLVYGAVGGVIYAIDYNTRQYKRLQEALILKQQDEEHEFSGTSIDNVTSLRNIRDSFDKNRQLSYIGFVIVYALQAIEAFVDAHLQNFDTEEDIGFKIRPTFEIQPDLGAPVYGLGIQIPLHRSSPKGLNALPNFVSP